MKLLLAARWIVLAATLTVAATSSAQTRVNSSPNEGDTGKPPVKPDKQYVFVRGFDNDLKDLEIVAADSVLPKAKWYGEQLKEFPGKSLDIVMQQCFGGGFIGNINASRNDFTVATAADWYEVSNGFAPLTFEQGQFKLTEMEDFTRPWWQDAFAGPNDGMLTHFNTALKGLGASEIAKDVFAPPGKMYKDKQNKDQLKIEHPQYASTGNAADARKLKDDNYAILVQWGEPDKKLEFEIQMARMYQALTDAAVGNIPANHIAVLFGKLNKGDKIGGQKLNDGVQLPQLTVSGPTTRDNWFSALNGNIFGDGNKPDANSHIFIYNNGHGGIEKQGIERETGIASNGTPTDIFKVSLTRGFDVSPIPNDDSNFGLADPDELVSVQIAAAHDIVASSLLVNGAPFSLGSPLGPDDIIRHVEDTLPPAFALPSPNDTLVYYELQVPHELLGLNPAFARFEFTGLDDSSAIRAFDFAGGTQELLNVVPEPTTITLLLTILPALLRRRRHREFSLG